jgi:hypothetical protein
MGVRVAALRGVATDRSEQGRVRAAWGGGAGWWVRYPTAAAVVMCSLHNRAQILTSKLGHCWSTEHGPFSAISHPPTSQCATPTPSQACTITAAIELPPNHPQAFALEARRRNCRDFQPGQRRRCCICYMSGIKCLRGAGPARAAASRRPLAARPALPGCCPLLASAVRPVRNAGGGRVRPEPSPLGRSQRGVGLVQRARQVQCAVFRLRRVLLRLGRGLERLRACVGKGYGKQPPPTAAHLARGACRGHPAPAAP